MLSSARFWGVANLKWLLLSTYCEIAVALIDRLDLTDDLLSPNENYLRFGGHVETILPRSFQTKSKRHYVL